MCGDAPALRWKSTLAGASNTSGSRLASSVLISTMSPFFIMTSPNCTSQVTVRRMLTMEYERSSSSTASPINSGLARSCACCSGLRAKWRKNRPRQEGTVSRPAMKIRKLMPSISSSVSGRPSISLLSR
ncbi:hypothetical protein D9M71_714930 [compost metagenome]